jgi:hypothetical protein
LNPTILARAEAHGPTLSSPSDIGHVSFIEYANESIRHSLWARAFYQMHKAAQKTHWVIIRALAFKWIRILFRCWQERTPYDEIRYLKSLQKSSSPLLQFLAQPPPPIPGE